MRIASSMVVYLRVTASGSMWSLTLRPSGAERCVITLHAPSCLGMTPIPEQWNGWNGVPEMGLRCVRVFPRVGGTRQSPRGAHMQRAGYVREGLYGGPGSLCQSHV